MRRGRAQAMVVVVIAVELLAIAAVAIGWPLLAWSEVVPYSLPLVVAASLFRALRRRTWAELAHGTRDHTRHHTLVAALAGALSLLLSILLGTPLVETLSNHAVDWSQFGFLRGNPSQLLVFAVWLAIAAIAAELALRGWIVERVLELSPGPPLLPILAGALAEALLTPGTLGVRVGAALFGIGLGWLYVASNRSIYAPIAARLTFSLGALLLDGLRLL